LQFFLLEMFLSSMRSFHNLNHLKNPEIANVFVFNMLPKQFQPPKKKQKSPCVQYRKASIIATHLLLMKKNISHTITNGFAS